MRFSELFGITRKASDRWFDPILDHDTALFLDPFLIHAYGASYPEFSTAGQRIAQFFAEALNLVASCNGKPKGPPFDLLGELVRFPEVSELCLGYTFCHTNGLGIGYKHSLAIANGLVSTPTFVQTWPEHFEAIEVFNNGIGPDRISDACANLLKPALAHYTQGVCRRHGVPTEPFTLDHFDFDPQQARWGPGKVSLPRNQYTDEAILLVPHGFLALGPTIWSLGFREYVRQGQDEELRERLKSRRKKDVRRLAGERDDLVTAYVDDLKRRLKAGEAFSPYDLVSDPAGLYRWDQAAAQFTHDHPLGWESIPSLSAFVKRVAERFKSFVEEHGGSSYLWNARPHTPKPERAAQLLFAGLLKRYATRYSVEIEGCLETGRGPIVLRSKARRELRTWLQVRRIGIASFRKGVQQLEADFFTRNEIELAPYLIVIQKGKYLTNTSDAKELDAVGNTLKRLARDTGIPFHVSRVDATA